MPGIFSTNLNSASTLSLDGLCKEIASILAPPIEGLMRLTFCVLSRFIPLMTTFTVSVLLPQFVLMSCGGLIGCPSSRAIEVTLGTPCAIAMNSLKPTPPAMRMKDATKATKILATFLLRRSDCDNTIIANPPFHLMRMLPPLTMPPICAFVKFRARYICTCIQRLKRATLQT